MIIIIQQNNLLFSWRWVEDHADPVAVTSMCSEYITTLVSKQFKE